MSTLIEHSYYWALLAYRSSRLEVFCKITVLRNFEKLTGKHLFQSLFFNKVEACNRNFLNSHRLFCTTSIYGNCTCCQMVNEHVEWSYNTILVFFFLHIQCQKKEHCFFFHWYTSIFSDVKTCFPKISLKIKFLEIQKTNISLQKFAWEFPKILKTAFS